MLSNNQFVLEPASGSDSKVFDSVYHLSLDYVALLKKRFGNLVSGVMYIVINGKSVMLNLDDLSCEFPHSGGNFGMKPNPKCELIIPDYSDCRKVPDTLGGAIDRFVDSEANRPKPMCKFEMDFDGADSRKANGYLGNFIIFLKKICQDPDVRQTTRNNYMFTYDKMVEFASLADFNDVNFDFLKKFEQWLSEDRGCNQNTIAKHVKVLRKAVNQAIRLGYMDVRNNPFFEYSVRVKRTEKETLSMNELALIDSYFHQRFEDMGERDREILGAFLFGCYTGLRFSDLVKVTRKQIVKRRTKHWLEVATQKTGKVVKIPLDDIFSGKAMEVLRRFNRKTGRLFMLPINAICNRRIKCILKKVHKRIRYQHVSFHTARRTMATLLLSLQVPITSVQTLLGHSSVKTTEVYAKVKEQTVYNDIRRCKTKSMDSLFDRTEKRMRKRFDPADKADG